MYTTRLLTVSPSMHYAGGWCLLRERGCLHRGVPRPGGAWLGVSASGGCLLERCLVLGGVPGPRGGAWSRGVSAPREWVSAPGGGCLVPGGLFQGDLLPADPPPPVNRFLTYATLLKILPCPKLRLRAVNMVTFTIACRFRHFLWDNVNRYWEPLACPWTLGCRRKCVYTERK